MWVKPAVSLNTIHLQQNEMRVYLSLYHPSVSPLSVRVGVYPDLVAGEVTVGVEVGGAARLHTNHVHVIAI